VEKNDYYSILQIDPSATKEEIRAAYKRLAFRAHPDRSDRPQATEETQLLNEAYDVLGNPEKRALYDLERLAATAPGSVEEPLAENTQAPVDWKKRAELKRLWNLGIRNRLKVFRFLILLTCGLFIGSLVTGRVNLLIILLIVLLAGYTVASIVLSRRSVRS
jgi:hypothetical protein